LRPGHCCAVTSASAHTLFYRSYWAAIYDLTDDKGISLFGAIRPGCWLNMISANGLMLMPEASSGCTCSFPIRCSMAMVPKPKKITSNWTVFVTHGAQTPVKNLAVNFGAPGDMRDSEGKLWFAYPRPKAVSGIGYGRYGVQFDLGDKLAANAGYFQKDYRGVEIEGTDKPWLYASGCRGILKCELPLIDDSASQKPGVYTLRLGFVAGVDEQPGDRIFDVKAQGQTILSDFDIIAQAGAINKSLVKEIHDIKVDNVLVLEFLSKTPEAATDQVPVINFLEVIRQDGKEAASAGGGGTAEVIFTSSTPEVLEKAQQLMQQQKQDEALELYHAVLNGDNSTAVKKQALEGMASVASAKSLAQLRNCWSNVSSILSGYKSTDPQVLNGTVMVALAIAEKIAENDQRRAVKVLEDTVPILADLTDANLKQQVIRKLGYIDSWRMLGPVSWTTGQKSIAEVYEAGRWLNPQETYQVGINQTFKWTDYTSPEPKVDLNMAFGALSKISVFAYAEFDLAQADDILLKIGSDDGFKCWFNGKLAGGFKNDRGWAADENVIKVTANSGKNSVLIQVIQSAGDWAFSARLTDIDGLPL